MNEQNGKQIGVDGLEHYAKARYASNGEVHATGIILGYVDAPAYIIVTSDGERVFWRADLTEVSEHKATPEQVRARSQLSLAVRKVIRTFGEGIRKGMTTI